MIAYIREYRDRFGVEPICAVLREHGVQIAPSTFYAFQARGFGLSDRDLSDAYLANQLFDLWVRNRRLYGRRKLWKAARRAGSTVGRDQVERLMRLLGVSGIRRGKRTTVTTTGDAKAARHPDHIQRRWAWPSRPDQWWVADFTYVWTPRGFCYVSFITDVFSRRILGWRVMTAKTTTLVLSALEQSLFTRRRTNVEFTTTGLLHHSDAGSQGGFNWSSQHLDHGGVARWRRSTGLRRRARFLKGLDASGARIARCGRRCARLGGLSRLGRCSGSSGV
ncbi:DDE-type integrase/transposase/recombinase [Leucobacter chironomi]|uniref:DDE-type integrase/transposase/recombinase n=1 Tax=Leucobacter chironomi TaxID=491918 RepID=UPI0003FD942B|nr:DDE-type integrase/transposase/recombinase [Leucobacter chironomi]